MRFLVVLPFLMMAGCATDASFARDHQTCRDRGLTEGTAQYTNCVGEVSDERWRRWSKSTRIDMSH